MRQRSEVKAKLRQVIYRHLQKKLRDNFKQRPETCCYNRQLVLDEATGSTVSLCGLMNARGEPRNILCDGRVPECLEMARECPSWSPIQTKQQIKEAHEELMAAGRGEIATEYPDIAALLWVLDAEVEEEEADIHPPLELDEEPPKEKGFFARLFS